MVRSFRLLLLLFFFFYMKECDQRSTPGKLLRKLSSHEKNKKFYSQIKVFAKPTCLVQVLLSI